MTAAADSGAPAARHSHDAVRQAGAAPATMAWDGDGMKPPACGSRRRRLWELPGLAHTLLLGLALPPELLRRTVEQALSRRHAARCGVAGAEVDVLFSAAHDCTSRNVLSEALHQRLDTRHALAVQRLTKLRNEDGLRAEWGRALTAPLGEAALPALLWALLTHPLGRALQERALHDMQCWACAHLRTGLAGAVRHGAVQHRADGLAQALAESRTALADAHRTAEARAQADAAELARLRGELARLTQPVVMPVSVSALQQASSQGSPARLAGPALEAERGQPQIETAAAAPAVAHCGMAKRRAAGASQGREPAPPQPDAAAGTAAGGPAAAPAHVPADVPAVVPANSHADAPALSIQGRTVLCVGGINGAVHRYRALVEARGGRFLHHDGGIEDKLQRLNSQLGAADLVLCQAGCVNHQAYQCVKAHCKRAGKACVYLERPSLSRFARELGPWPTSGAGDQAPVSGSPSTGRWAASNSA